MIVLTHPMTYAWNGESTHLLGRVCVPRAQGLVLGTEELCLSKGQFWTLHTHPTHSNTDLNTPG